MTAEIKIYKAATAAVPVLIKHRSFQDSIDCIELTLQPGQEITLTESSEMQLLILPVVCLKLGQVATP